jgi:UDP-glucose-4-epimerase GalE
VAERSTFTTERDFLSRILVTGGAGYIGSHTAKALVNSGHEPVVYDNLSTGHAWAVKWGPLVVGDLCDADLLRKTIEEYEIESVIHFAASAYVGDSVRKPRQYYRNNMCNTMNLLEVMLEAGIANVVFSSSCATYGEPQTIPISEQHIQDPLSPYGESKHFVERMLRSYGMAYGLQWVSLRYFNAAGADAAGEIGEVHDPETHLIPLAFHAATGQIDALEILGTDYATPDGTAIRDYIHVSDLAAAHVSAADYLSDRNPNVAINLGNGTGYSVREVVDTVEAITELRVPVVHAPRRQGDAPALVADADRAHTLLGWQPRYPDLKSIISTAWNWYSGSGPEHLQRAEARSGALLHT